ncbi:MAG: putative lipid II flippase FtsW [candidate division Zixibacteria bacterium]|nr:putative lipid II flippase FtsW [candidate division Zixibacteria bacterium]
MKPWRADMAIDERLLVAYVLLLLIGLTMMYSASSILAESRFGSHTYFIRQQVVWALLSVGCIWVLGRLDLQRLAVYSVPALLFTMLLLSLVFLMPARNGSHRWLFLGPLTVQPSEMFKFFTIVYLAFSLSNPKRNLGDWRQILFPYVPILGLGILLIILEPDLGAVVVLAFSVLGMFFLAGARLSHLALATIPPTALASFVVFVLGYKKARVLDYLAAVTDPLQGSYQVKQAVLTFGSGGLFGTGLGDGRQKLFFLPYPHTDFILATIGEELGFIGLLVILGLMFYLLWRGCRIAMHQPDRFGFLLAAGMTWALFVNIATNIGVVTSLLPVTGRALPFLSYGGSSLLMSSAAIGVLSNLSRRIER